MAKLNILCGIIVLIGAAISLGEPAVNYITGPPEISTVLDNRWGDGQYPVHRVDLKIDGREHYQNLLKQDNKTLDDLDLAPSTYARVQTADKIWQYNGNNSPAGISSKMSAAKTIRKKNYNAKDDDPESGATFEYKSNWAYGAETSRDSIFNRHHKGNGSDNNSGQGGNPLPSGGGNVPSQVPVAPAPASILLGTIGVALVGFLRNRKTRLLS